MKLKVETMGWAGGLCGCLKQNCRERLYEKEEEREVMRRKTSIIRNKGKEIIKIRKHKVNGW